MGKAKVYFTRKITPESLVSLYEKLGVSLPAKVAVKLSTGEAGNPNYLNPDLIKDLVQKVDGTIIECNTAYEGKRFHSQDHWKVAQEHGFTKIAPVDIMDEDGEISLPVTGGKHLKENFVRQNLKNYSSVLVLSHFKGHPMGGIGGALKNIAIGIASSHGKGHIHNAGVQRASIWDAPQDDFLESMAEAAKSVVDYFTPANMAYVSVANNLSVDCDCVATPEPVCMADIGAFASLNPVALDQACVDAIYQSEDPGKAHMIERMETRNAVHILEHGEAIGLASREYELICIDE